MALPPTNNRVSLGAALDCEPILSVNGNPLLGLDATAYAASLSEAQFDEFFRLYSEQHPAHFKGMEN